MLPLVSFHKGSPPTVIATHLLRHTVAQVDTISHLPTQMRNQHLYDKWLLMMASMLPIRGCNKISRIETRMYLAVLQLGGILRVELPKVCPNNFQPVVSSNLVAEDPAPTTCLAFNSKQSSSSNMNNTNSNLDKLTTTCNGQLMDYPQVAPLM